jgi:hypothetical protein
MATIALRAKGLLSLQAIDMKTLLGISRQDLIPFTFFHHLTSLAEISRYVMF